MYKIIKQYKLPQEVVNLIRNSYEGSKCCVKAQVGNSQMFDVKIVVRQADVWLLILFCLVINNVLAHSVHLGIDIGHCVADLDFTDDVAFLCVSHSEVEKKILGIEFLAEAVRLK